MKNKRGFTLIELLAVIVIIAIIALIATPMVLNYINLSKEKSLTISVNNYAKAIGNALISSDIDYDGIYKIMSNGYLCKGTLKEDKTCDGDILEVKIEKSHLNNGDVYINDSDIVISYYDETIKKQVSKLSNGNVVIAKESGAGLYFDSLEPGRLIYKGGTTYTDYSGDYPTGTLVKKEKEEPNNYIMFNNTLYRIVSIETDGTYKIISDKEVGKSLFDTDNPDDPNYRSNANNTYCQASNYYGCNAFVEPSKTIYNGVQVTDNIFVNGIITGTVTNNSTIYNYLMEYYNGVDAKSKEAIEPHLFNIGGTDYKATLEMAKTQEGIRQIKSNIGLLNYIDWFNATNNPECDVRTNGYYDTTTNNNYEYYKCAHDNYLYTNLWWWTFSPLSSNRSHAMFVSTNGRYENNFAGVSGGVRPVFYLKSDINLIGQGTEKDPYIIK